MKILLTVLVLLLGTTAATVSGAPAPQSTKAAAPAGPTSELDRLVAPIALYPDQLIAQMLLCAADPPQVAEFHTYLTANAALKGTQLQDAATVDGFEPSFVALALFPQVIKQMAQQLDWTKRLGAAFAADRSAVFSSIQKLRAQAKQAGTLTTTPQQQVTTQATTSGQQVIVIEPANPQVVYVPQYDPQVVYTQPSSTTVVVKEDDDDDELIAGLIGFGAGVALGAAIDNDYYYGPYGWHGGAYMYNDGWDDWYDAREDAREDWADHRENLASERGEQRTQRAEGRQQTSADRSAQRTERQDTRQGSRPDAQAQREQRRAESPSATTGESRTARGTTGETRTRSGSFESRGYGGGTAQTSRQRSGTRSDAFSGYSGGGSARASSSRGQASRSASRGGASRSGGRRR